MKGYAETAATSMATVKSTNCSLRGFRYSFAGRASKMTLSTCFGTFWTPNKPQRAEGMAVRGASCSRGPTKARTWASVNHHAV